MVERCDRPGFAPEPLRRALITRPGRQKLLERNESAELAIARPVDDTHPASTDFREFLESLANQSTRRDTSDRPLKLIRGQPTPTIPITPTTPSIARATLT